MNKFRVLIADVDEAFVTAASAYLSYFENIDIVSTCRNGFDVVALTKTYSPDIVVMNLILEGMDGITALRKLKGMPMGPHVLICTEFCNDFSIRCAQKSGADGFLCKPLLLNSLYMTLCEFADVGVRPIISVPEPDTNIDIVLMDRLAYIGISASCAGYSMLITAVKFALSDPEALSSLNKKLYPIVADIHSTTKQRVERNIRTVIKSAFARGMINEGGKAPTNKQFITRLINEIKSSSSTL